MGKILNFIKSEYILIISTIAVAFTMYLGYTKKVDWSIGVTTLITFEVFIDKIDKRIKKELRLHKQNKNKNKTKTNE